MTTVHRKPIRRRLLFTAAIIGILCFCFSGCSEEKPHPAASEAGQNPGSKETPQQIRIIDGNGEEITVHKPVERIVAEYMNNAELLRILKKSDKVVGVSGFAHIFKKCRSQFPEFSKKPSVGYFWNLDYEAILDMKAELLLTFGPNVSEKKENLPGVDVVFLGLYYPDLINPAGSRFIRGVRNLGEILDAQDQAEAYINWHVGLIGRITSRTEKLPEDKKPKVFIAQANAPILDTTAYSTYPRKDTLTQACLIAGGKSIAAELPEYAQQGAGIQVDPEWLIAQNPEIMILHAVDRVDMYGYEADDITEVRKSLNRFLERPELVNVKAVRNGKVYIFDGHFRNDASGGVLGAAYMAKIFHPELFADMDPEALHQEYLDMQELDYDVNQHGIFLYPPLEAGGSLIGIPDSYKGQIF